MMKREDKVYRPSIKLRVLLLPGLQVGGVALTDGVGMSTRQ